MHDANAVVNSSTIANNDSALPQRDDPEWTIRIRHKQERGLLLFIALPSVQTTTM